MEEIQEIHDLHIWLLSGQKQVATIHVVASDEQ
jgi:Co/Zn/Cd efflux system component